MRIIFAIIFFVGLFTSSNSKAQDNTLFFMDAHPQSNLLNPAIQYNYSTFIFTPSLNLFIENSSLTFNTIFNPKTVYGKSILAIDFESMENKLRPNNFVNASIETSPFFIGKKLKNDMYGTFSFSLKNKTYFKYPETIVDLRYGNADLTNNRPRTIDLNHYSLNETTYAEYSFGLSKKYNKNLTIGAHVKFLMGLLAAQTTQFLASVETNEDFSESLLKTDIHMNISAPLINVDKHENKLSINNTILSNNLGETLLSLKNYGFAIDLGFTYKINENLDIYGSINDLGFIRWGAQPQHLVSKGEYLFDGLYFSSENLDNFDAKEYFNHYADTIASTFIPTTSSENFNTWLFTKTYLGATYRFNDKFSLKGLVKSTLLSDVLYAEGTIGGTYYPRKKLALTGTWSYSSYSLYNFGFGILVNGEKLQFYAVTDNINSIDIINSKGINFALGLNFRIIPWNLSKHSPSF